MDLNSRSRQGGTTGDSDSFNEKEVVRLIIAGKRTATEKFIRHYQLHVFKVVAGRVPESEVQDIVHKTFMNALKSLPTYTFKKPVAHWLSRIATCRCYDYWRKQGTRKKEVPASSLHEYHQWATEITGDFSSGCQLEEEAKQRARELTHWALSQLSAEDRMVVTLVHLEGFSAQEAAEQLGWTTVNVRVRSHRSRKKLRRLLASVLEGESK